jgi:hypothetical protein
MLLALLNVLAQIVGRLHVHGDKPRDFREALDLSGCQSNRVSQPEHGVGSFAQRDWFRPAFLFRRNFTTNAILAGPVGRMFDRHPLELNRAERNTPNGLRSIPPGFPLWKPGFFSSSASLSTTALPTG